MIELRDLTVRYGDTSAVRELSFCVQPGSITGLLGPNGAGKTTTLRAITGLVSASSGGVRVCDQTPAKASHLVGYVPQEIALYPSLSVEKNIAFFASLKAPHHRADEEHRALEVSGLKDHRSQKVSKLSGGMKRRLNLAVALLGAPQVLVCDEPLVGVDAQSRELILETLVTLREKGMAILYTTHNLLDAEQICDQLVILDHGRALATGKTSELLAEHAHFHVEADGTNAKEIEDALAAAGLSAKVKPQVVGSLSDLYLSITGRHLRD